MFNHVSQLLLHRHRKQHDKIHQQYRPKHRHVKHREEGHGKGDEQALRGFDPKLKLWQFSNEWSATKVITKREPVSDGNGHAYIHRRVDKIKRVDIRARISSQKRDEAEKKKKTEKETIHKTAYTVFLFCFEYIRKPMTTLETFS